MSELPPVAAALADLIGRRCYLLGHLLEDRDLAMRDPSPTALALAAKLLAGDPDAGASTLELAWPDCEPPATWWSTPLGAATALATTDDHLDTDRAALILGVTPAAITEDLDAGRLDRHPDGGATLSSVRSRVAVERPEIH